MPWTHEPVRISIEALVLSAACVLIALAGNLTLWRVAERNCQNIERLKAQARAEAIRSFNELPQNAALLHITLTAAAVEKAKQQRDRTLAEYASTSCSFIPWK